MATLLGPWVAVVALAFAATRAFQHQHFWLDEVQLTVDAGGAALAYVVVLVCGASAFDTSRLFEPGRDGLVVSSKLRSLSIRRVVMWAALPAIASQVLVTGTFLAIALWNHRYFNPLARALLELMTHAVAVFFFAALGALIGRLFKPGIAAVAGVAAGFVMQGVGGGGNGDRFSAVDFGGATLSRLGLEFSLSYATLQMVLLVIAGAWLLWAAARHPSVARGSRWFLFGAAAVAIVIVSVAWPGAPSARWIVAPEPPSDCRGDGPVVCTFEEHVRVAGEAVPLLRDMVQAASEAGYTAFVAERVIETSRSYEPLPGSRNTRTMDLAGWATADYDIGYLVHRYVTPYHCPQLVAERPPSDWYYEAVGSLATTFLTVAAVPDDTDSQVVGAPLTSAEAEELTERLFACDF